MTSELLTVEQMYHADQAAVDKDVPGIDLMEAAGTVVERVIRKHYRPCRVAVLCGPGNNGGDGFVVARLLQKKGWSINLAFLGSSKSLRGDAAINADRWKGRIKPFDKSVLDNADLIVDAVFGAGLARPVDGEVAAVFEKIIKNNIPVVSIDVPSGVDGNTGEILGIAPKAQHTVTFFRAKPGHFLLPGKRHVGRLTIGEIGIPESVLDEIKPKCWINDPARWKTVLPERNENSHKYTNGHAVIVGGTMTGAARLAALGARRAGAGLVSIACSPSLAQTFSTSEPGNIVAPISSSVDLAILMEDKRKNALLIGPGAGVGEKTRSLVQTALRGKQAVVLDADALSAFEDDPETLFSSIEGRCLLTPHEGEFSRLFDFDGCKLSRAREAAKLSGATVLLKGHDTVVAAPDGRAVINSNAPLTLSTGGSGDVLAGIAAGLMAQGMAVFEAACAAVWIHSDAAKKCSVQLIAEDLPEKIPEVLNDLKGPEGRYEY